MIGVFGSRALILRSAQQERVSKDEGDTHYLSRLTPISAPSSFETHPFHAGHGMDAPQDEEACEFA